MVETVSENNFLNYTREDLKINGWNIIPWRFGIWKIIFLSKFSWFVGSIVIFQGEKINNFWLVKNEHFGLAFPKTMHDAWPKNPSHIHVWDTIMVVKIMAMQTTWIGGKSVAKTTGKLIKGPRTSSGTPNHQLSNRNRKTKKRTAATKWSCLLALHFGTYQVAVDKSYVFTRFFESGNLKDLRGDQVKHHWRFSLCFLLNEINETFKRNFQQPSIHLDCIGTKGHEAQHEDCQEDPTHD